MFTPDFSEAVGQTQIFLYHLCSEIVDCSFHQYNTICLISLTCNFTSQQPGDVLQVLTFNLLVIYGICEIHGM